MDDMQTVIHIIFMNDAPMFAWYGKEKDAEEKMEALAKEYWEKNKATLMTYDRLNSLGLKNSKDKKAVYEDYRSWCYWHIQTVQSNIAQSPQG